jgi:hypothetical protein
MTFPPAREPKTHEDFLNLLPDGLRSFIDREVAAGNGIAEAGLGFPAAPVGVWIKLTTGFRTAGGAVEDVAGGEGALPVGAVYRRRPQWTWPAECTDAARHFFILSGPEEAPVLPKGREKPLLPDLKRIPRASPPRPPVVSVPLFGYADKFDEAGLQGRVSRALEKHLGLNLDAASWEVIRAEVGEDGLALAKEIDCYANRAEFWQNARSADRAYEQVQRDLANRYPYLSAGAIQRLSTRAAWSWR